MIQILHNPRCGKSRNGIAFLEATGKPFQIIKYLDNPLTVAELEELIQKLDLSPIHLVRQKEKLWIEQFKNKSLSDTNIIQAIATHPILMERPIIIYGKKAVIGRTFENLSHIV